MNTKRKIHDASRENSISIFCSSRVASLNLYDFIAIREELP